MRGEAYGAKTIIPGHPLRQQVAALACGVTWLSIRRMKALESASGPMVRLDSAVALGDLYSARRSIRRVCPNALMWQSIMAMSLAVA